MSRRFAWTLGIVQLTIAAGIVGAPAAQAHGEVDQENIGVCDGGHDLTAFYPIGQTFVPQADVLAGLDVHLTDYSLGDIAMSTIFVEVWQGLLGDTFLAKTRILLPDGFADYAHVHFSPPVGLVSGQRHSFIVYVKPDEVGPFRGNWLIDTEMRFADSYVAGEMIFQGVPFAQGDLCFRTWAPSPAEPMSVDCDPNTILLRSRGRWITCYLEPAPGRGASEIDAATARLDSWDAPVLDGQHGFSHDSGGYLVDHDSDGVLERLLKFDRQVLMGSLVPGDHRFLVEGTFTDGTLFRGESDVIRVIG